MTKVLIWSLMVAICAPYATAQVGDTPPVPASERARADSDDAEAGCSRPEDAQDDEFDTTLPLELLTYLDRVSSSPFVHAYLLNHVATYGKEGHWMVACANTFTTEDVKDLLTLRRNRLQTRTILNELREVAEARRRDEAILGDSGQVALTSLTNRALRELGASSAASYLGYFTQFKDALDCSDDSDVCSALDTVKASVQDLRNQAIALSELSNQLAKLREEAEETGGLLREAEATVQQDSLSRGDILEFMTLPDLPDSLRATAADTSEVWNRLENSRERRRKLRTDLANTVEERSDLAEQVVEQQEKVAKAIRVSREKLEELREKANGKSIVLGASQVVTESYSLGASTIDVTPPAAALATGPGAAASADLLVGLVDFVVGRAKQELVLGYIAGIYEWAHEETLIQVAFPQTFRLMRSLSNERDGDRLSVRAAGRVPTNVWRATLAEDFRRLPLNLIKDNTGRLCGRDEACRSHLRQLRVVGEASYRLIDGQPALDVIGQLPVIASGGGIASDTTWTRTVEALRLVSFLAQTYRSQGFIPRVGTERYEYVLTAETFAQSTPRLRRAFIRTLLVQVIPEADPVPAGIDVRALEENMAETMRTIEALWAVLSAENGGTNRPVAVVRATLATLATSIEIAQAISGEEGATTSTEWEEIARLWGELSRVVESMANRDYGLAMAQTTALVGSVSRTPLPSKVLALTGLAVGLAEATDGAQVQSALETAASPIGGWQAKRYGEPALFSLTAYPGAATGYEWLTQDRIESDGSWTVGTSLPIGLELQLPWLLPGPSSLTNDSWCFGVCSVGLFIPVLDLGALLNYRLEDTEEVEAEPNFSLRQVFAPGLFLSLGLGRSPVTILAGAQFMPSLREVKVTSATAAETETANAIRLGASVVMDLVLFEF